MRNKNNVDGSLAYYENHVKVFDIEMIKFYTMYNNVISSHWIQAYKQGSERKKRGWINAGGSLLKTVFGVALDSDIRAIEKKVNFLENQEFGNSEVLVNLRDQLKENNNALIHVEKELQKLRHDSSGFHAQLNLLSYVTLATSYLQSLNNFLATVKTIQAEVEKTLLYALAKSSSPSIYTYDLLNPFIQKVTLGTGLETPVKLERGNMAKFLRYTWSAVPTANEFSVVLIIPFVNHATFDTVKVHSFPTMKRNARKRVTLDYDYDYFFIQTPTLRQSRLTQKQMENCLEHVEKYVCPLFSSVSDSSTEDCIASIYLTGRYSKKESDSSICRYKTYEDSSPYAITIKNHNFVSFEDEVDSILHCENNRTEISTGKIYVIKPGCFLTTPSNTFFGQQHKIVKATQNENVLPVFPLLTLAPLEEVKQEPSTTEKMKTPRFNENLDKITTMRPYTWLEGNTTVLTYSLPSGTILIITVIILVTVCLWRKRSANRNNQTQNESYEMRRPPGERVRPTPELPPMSNHTMSAPALNTGNHYLSNSNRHFSRQISNARSHRENTMSESNAYDTVSTIYSEPAGSITSRTNLRWKNVHNRPPTRAPSRVSMNPSSRETYGHNTATYDVSDRKKV